MVDDPALIVKERLAFVNHLQNCQECAREYEESRFVIDLAREHWQISEDTLALIEKANKYVKSRMTVEEGWEDLKHRIPELAQLEKHQERLQLFHKVGAVAACLIIGISIILTFSYLKPEFAQESIPEKAIFAQKPSFKVELVSDNGKLLIPLGHEIAAAKELKNLIINDKHRIVMNASTSLSIDQFDQNGRFGCIVKLASGELFTNVEHDGNPFVVSTTHGKAVITGTTFNVKVTDDSTTLVVAEGTVQFESAKGAVEVAAGQISEIVTHSAPTKPISCNTIKLTAWATDHELKTALAKIEPFSDAYDITDPWLSAMSSAINLENIDYEDWIEEKRDWFMEEFPWIFQLKGALAKEGVKVDYPGLLVQSGDIWQFVCLQKFPTRFSVPDFESLLKTATSYGFGREWLLENVPMVRIIRGKSFLSQNPTGLAALEQLLKYTNGTEATPYYLYPADACKYLAETRSLIWFAARDGQYDLSDQKRTKVLVLLQEEVTAACKYQNDKLYPEDKLRPFCDEDKCQDEVKLVSVIYECEKTLDMYIPVSSMLK